MVYYYSYIVPGILYYSSLVRSSFECFLARRSAHDGLPWPEFDFAGEDSAWYALISDLPSIHPSMRVTSPVPSVPERTYIAGLAVITTDNDGIEHSIAISVIDPHSLDSSCPEGVSRCVAHGSLRVVADGEEILLAPGVVTLAPDIAIAGLNLHGECRSFGFEKYWELKQLEQAKAGRKLTETGMQDMGD